MDEVMDATYKVKTTGFEGPFGLLLNLIEDRKLFINEISLSQVTEDYLNYLKNLNNLNPTEVSAFITVAATLILIKSKSLLPNLSLTKEEEGDIKDLEEKLRLYELYSRLSVNIKNTFGKKIIFPALERRKEVLIFLPDDQITPNSMMILAQDLLGRIPVKTFLPEVEVKKVINIEEMIDKLKDRIENALKMNFKEFAGKSATKEEKVFVIVGFLAMLELVRQGILHAGQDNNFEDIILEKRQPEENENFNN